MDQLIDRTLLPAKIGSFDFTITAIDADSQQPLSGVTIAINDINGNNILSYDPGDNSTNETGTLYLTGIPTDQDYTYVLSKNGYSSTVGKIADLLGFSDWTISLQKISSTNRILVPVVIGTGLLLLYNSSKKKKVGKIETSDIVNTGIAIGGGYLLFNSIGIVDKLLEAIGLKDSKETQTLNYTSTDPNSFWNPNYWMQYTSFTYSINEQQARDIIGQIKNALGWWNDDEAAIMAAFKQLRTQANLSFVAWEFNKTDGADLLTWLRGTSWPYDRLSDAEVYSINQYFSKLPTH